MNHKVTTLISCMYEKNANIIARSNIQTDVVVVNQCDYDSIEEFEFKNKKGVTCRAKFMKDRQPRNVLINWQISYMYHILTQQNWDTFSINR